MFADTSGLAAFADHRQTYHALAAELMSRACDEGRLVVTTNYVLAELTALLASPLRVPRSQQIAFLTDLRAADWVEVISLDAALEAAAWQLWEARADKEWSFVDCASFIVMQRRGLTEALTSDHHFE